MAANHLKSKHNITEEGLTYWLGIAMMLSRPEVQKNPNLLEYLMEQRGTLFDFHKEALHGALGACFPNHIVFIVDFKTTGDDANRESMHIEYMTKKST